MPDSATGTLRPVIVPEKIREVLATARTSALEPAPDKRAAMNVGIGQRAP
jgi:hypothetical protein